MMEMDTLETFSLVNDNFSQAKADERARRREGDEYMKMLKVNALLSRSCPEERKWNEKKKKIFKKITKWLKWISLWNTYKKIKK